MELQIPPKWGEILTKVQTIYPEAVIAGGCLRDLDHGKEPKDIDIFVESYNPDKKLKPTKPPMFVRERVWNFLEAAIEAMTEPTLPTKLQELGFTQNGSTTFYFHQGADKVIKTVYEDQQVEIIEMKGAYTPWSVLNRFDFGLNRIAWDGKELFVSDYYREDKTNRTCTLRSACNKSHYDFLLTEKWEKRLKIKYPDLSLVIPNEFRRQYQEEL